MDLTYVAIVVFVAFIAYFIAASALARRTTNTKTLKTKNPKRHIQGDEAALRKRIVRRFKDD
jgi:hypothetical protein|tara:strand:+ start:5130 stop:5315 length:186 start_codon:yes stop_codon:yes gene_type:complete